MEDERDSLDSILHLLDDCGMGWLTDEVRQLRLGRNEPSISAEEVAKSRQTYDAKGGESPFRPVERLTPEGEAEPLAYANYLEFVAARIQAISGQLEQADLDAAGLGITHIKLGFDTDRGDHKENPVELLASLREDLRSTLLQ